MPARIAAVLAVAMAALDAAGFPAQQLAPPPTAPAAPPAPAAARSLRNANYVIAARLDPATRTISGDQRLGWRNVANVPATTLRFHLYYNAWRNTKSSWMRERMLATPSIGTRPESDWGWIDVTRLPVMRPGAGEMDLTSRLRFIAPDDGNLDDRTVLEAPLETPVGPGETVTVQIAWSSRVPRTFARKGVIGNYYFVAQWFPKIGVLEDTGWNCHQFHAPTEFFADFGTYDVRLTVPRGWVLGATGREGDRDGGDEGQPPWERSQSTHDDMSQDRAGSRKAQR